MEKSSVKRGSKRSREDFCKKSNEHTNKGRKHSVDEEDDDEEEEEEEQEEEITMNFNEMLVSSSVKDCPISLVSTKEVYRWADVNASDAPKDKNREDDLEDNEKQEKVYYFLNLLKNVVFPELSKDKRQLPSFRRSVVR